MPAKKATASKRPARKAANKNAAPTKEDELPDLETFLIDLYNWPDVNHILMNGPFKEASEEFSNVAEFRKQIKDNLAACYNSKRRIPKTPKKLAHKPAPLPPMPQVARVIDFEIDEIVVEEEGGNQAAHIEIIQTQTTVPQTPIAYLKSASSSAITRQPSDKLNTQSSFTQFLPASTAIPETPTSASRHQQLRFNELNLHDTSRDAIIHSPVFLSRNAMTMPASASRPLLRPAAPINRPRLVTPNTPKSVCEINRRLEEANNRHEEILREKQEHAARNNEQRQRRVHQNRMHQQQEKDAEAEERRKRQERIRLFEEAQRTPKTPLKNLGLQNHVIPPQKALTPRSREVPQKRSKQDDKPVQSEIQRVPSASRIPVPKARPAVISKPSPEPPVEISTVQVKIDFDGDDSVIIEERSASVVMVEEHENTMNVDKQEQPSEEDPVHHEQVSTTSTAEDIADEPEVETANKENNVKQQPTTPIATKVKADESAYEMTPDKVYKQSTENDYNVDDLSSGDETDDENHPRKKVPKWAEKDNLRREVQKLYRSVSKDVVNAHFGVLRPPRLVELFASTSKKYEHVSMNETTACSPISNPRVAPLTANQRLVKN